MDNFKCMKTLRVPVGGLYVVKYNVDGQYCLSGGQDKIMRLWNVSNGTLVAPFSGHGREILDIAVSQNNSSIASCGGDKLVFVWDVSTVKVVKRLSGHDQRVNCVSFNQESNVLISGSYDASIRLWDLRSPKSSIQCIKDARDSVSGVECHGHLILSSSIDGCIRMYDIRQGKVTQDSITFPVTNATFSNDKNCILISSLDSTIRLLDKDSGELLNDYSSHQNVKYKLAACLDNTDAYVLSGSEDHDIYIWDLVDANVVSRLQGHSNVVNSIAYHPKNCELVSASVDGTIKVWS